MASYLLSCTGDLKACSIPYSSAVCILHKSQSLNIAIVVPIVVTAHPVPLTSLVLIRKEKTPKKWKDNKRKLAKQYGVSTSGKVVPKNSWGPPCTCKRQCTSLLNDEEKAAMISKLYDGRPKNELDTYLSGLEAKPVQRRRQRSEQNIKPRSSKFFILYFKNV
ncbi:unnamed protein product [Psylliodes chrysocephalus]|uniref:Uncharacterized protein n=1 Tax=Psylliodes chrysocephalus TaxID=3402493 RepID=A0A9P0D8Q4_9CUCU|nr:unnamed protein product [Psylliodes chrysocephala]